MTESYDSMISRLQFVEGVFENKKAHHARVSKDVDSLRHNRDILAKVEKILKMLLDKLVKNDLTKMDALITYGLETVFPNRDIKFHSKVTERGHRMGIDLQTIYRGNVVSSRTRSSVHVIESLLIRILCILKMKRARFILMDETFSAVDSDYLDALGQLITELCRKLGFDILLVTHNPGFADHTNNSYRISQRDANIEVRKIK